MRESLPSRPGLNGTMPGWFVYLGLADAVHMSNCVCLFLETEQSTEVFVGLALRKTIIVRILRLVELRIGQFRLQRLCRYLHVFPVGFFRKRTADISPVRANISHISIKIC